MSSFVCMLLFIYNFIIRNVISYNFDSFIVNILHVKINYNRIEFENSGVTSNCSFLDL